jgi:hypothetical protein
MIMASALAACAALPAKADSTARRDTEMGATVAKVCHLGSVTMTGGSNASFNAQALGGEIALGTLANGDTARAMPASISVTFDSVCNETLFIRLVSANGGLAPDNGAPASGGFANRVDYTADLTWGAEHTSLTTGGSSSSSAGVQLPGAQAGAVTLNITIPAGSQPLVAGDYSDVLRVEFAESL